MQQVAEKLAKSLSAAVPASHGAARGAATCSFVYAGNAQHSLGTSGAAVACRCAFEPVPCHGKLQGLGAGGARRLVSRGSDGRWVAEGCRRLQHPGLEVPWSGAGASSVTLPPPCG